MQMYALYVGGNIIYIIAALRKFAIDLYSKHDIVLKGCNYGARMHIFTSGLCRTRFSRSLVVAENVVHNGTGVLS